ncbi:MAG: SufD family Fe-S cluster assembly protein [Erysipelotrichaceae bacterium]|nr:SufD family Fe-S cluster assembly protein [Erysipelotrichaceae bacterium]
MATKVVCVDDTIINVLNNDYLMIELKPIKAMHIKIRTIRDSEATLIIQIADNDKEISISTLIEPNSKLNVLYLNRSTTLKIKETVDISEGGNYQVAYGELEAGILDRIADYNLNGYKANIDLISTAIINEHKHQELNCHHLAKSTTSLMQTYGVLLNKGDYYIKANGHIIKGASGSKSHQASRVLTFADKQQAKIIPLLLIDENDVEASHAMSIGQLDENQLYYLESRGLTKVEALRLIALGYLLPITKVINDQKLNDELLNVINEKVLATCLI